MNCHPLSFNCLETSYVRQQQSSSRGIRTLDNHAVDRRIKLVRTFDQFRWIQDINPVVQAGEFAKLDWREARIASGCAYRVIDDLRRDVDPEWFYRSDATAKVAVVSAQRDEHAGSSGKDAGRLRGRVKPQSVSDHRLDCEPGQLRRFNVVCWNHWGILSSQLRVLST